MLVEDFLASPLGQMWILADEHALLGIYFIGQVYELRGYENESITQQETTITKATKEWLTSYFAGQEPQSLACPRAVRGTDFQEKVCDLLTHIPYGQTWTYGQIAERLGCKSAQAVGSAIGKNPLSILVPCHRVVGVKGQLTGYAGGLERKEALLEWEKTHVHFL
ncbi:methylated-DNA--[protein]-cysteine S-methyltransferase [Streptococcus sp. X16XC17]|uniref:methylated-DNA--[protein]-cysteine S-methyltransferase n=1 Tax=unclassified Streptococcus TaxID=2608887 RepID=UPI00066FF0D7|nr:MULTISPECIES: methylated-DNA--[protein]-cysteine S-methyltransferase [unclassified Streptococcus]TCD46794.1 methylated-DNA--[protein]-cysteine S-methyltransferase [Streptococcus sp. X16XC17]